MFIVIMSLNEIYNLILLIGAVIMLIMSFFLWFYPKNYLHNKVLGALVFIWSFCVILYAIKSKDFYSQFPFLFRIESNLMFLFFPLMYIYIKTFLLKGERTFKKYLFHFIPFFLFAISLSPFYFQTAEEKINIIELGTSVWLTSIFRWGDVFIILGGVIYSVLSYRVLLVFETNQKHNLTQQVSNALKWIRIFLAINLILLAVGTVGVFIEILHIKILFDVFKINYMGLTILTIGAGVFTFFNQKFFDSEDETNEELDLLFRRVVSSVEKQSPELTIVSSKWQMQNQEAENKRDMTLIIDFIEKSKPFLNNKMTLKSLAKDMGLSRNRVSELLNTSIGLSFYDIINEYRVKEVILLIKEGKHKHHKLVYLAELAGFNSKATFNRIFKKVTGKTPSEYIEEIDAA